MPAESERGRERESAISPVIRNAKVSLGSLIIQSRKTEGAEKKKKGTLLFHNASPERTFKLGGKLRGINMRLFVFVQFSFENPGPELQQQAAESPGVSLSGFHVLVALRKSIAVQVFAQKRKTKKTYKLL